MNEQIDNADSVKETDNTIEQVPNFAAVPIHFRPKEGARKMIKLVIPGIEPPLGFFVVEGDSPETLTMSQVEGPFTDDSGTEAVEEKIDQSTEEPSEDDATLDPEPDEEETPDDDVIEYPHEDDSGNPIAGFLLGSEEHMPLVIIVRPEPGQTATEAMDSEGEKHPEHMPGSLDEAEKLLGHSPLTVGDN